MAQQLRALKRRIDSVKSTQKITRAMELIASSRIIRAQQRVEAARPYAEEMRRLMGSVANNVGNIDHPLLKPREGNGGTTGMIVVTSDRGLAGAYNSNIIRAAERDIQGREGDTKLYVLGKKGLSYFRFRGYEYEEAWTGVSETPTIEDARRAADAAARAFSEGVVDEVRFAYTRFQSALTQRPTIVQLLPVPKEQLEEMAGAEREREGPRPQYEFEPQPEEILGLLLPRYVEAVIFQGMLESAASELASRRRAMKAATDNAEELIEDLTRNYNQARQAEITTEIMEVIGGAEALTASARQR